MNLLNKSFKQLLDEVEHDFQNYLDCSQYYLPKPKANSLRKQNSVLSVTQTNTLETNKINIIPKKQLN
jgi:hypothetical protein